MTSTKSAFRVHKFVEHEMYEVHVSRSRFGDVTTRVTQGHAGPTLREAATLRTASVAAPPLAAKPETLFRSLGALLAASAPAPATPSVAGARLSPATQDAYEPASVLRHSHVSTTDLSIRMIAPLCRTVTRKYLDIGEPVQEVHQCARKILFEDQLRRAKQGQAATHLLGLGQL